MQYLILSLIKIFDNIILTAKSITTYQGRKILSSILVVISQLLFYLVIDQVVNDNTILLKLIISVSSGIGNYIAFCINDKFKKDEQWTMKLTSSCIDDIKELCNYLNQHKIEYEVNIGYDKDWNNAINVTALSKTKNESRLIKGYLESTETKYSIKIIK